MLSDMDITRSDTAPSVSSLRTTNNLASMSTIVQSLSDMVSPKPTALIPVVSACSLRSF